MTPEDFAKLTREEMFAELRMRGIVHGQASTDAELVSFYSEWYEKLTTPPEPLPEAQRAANVEDERRSTERARVNLEIGLRTETNFYVGFSGDISEGGIFLTTVELLPIGTVVSLSFSFPGGLEVEAEGEVAWTRQGVTFDSDLEAGMGIRFTHLSADALATIKEFTSLREPIFHAD